MKISYNNNFITVSFEYPLRILSSALFRGGMTRSSTIVNLKVHDPEKKAKILQQNPDALIGEFIQKENLNKDAVGLVTSADIKYAQFICSYEKDTAVLAIVTSGLSNAVNVAEHTETAFTGEPFHKPGTINIIVITNAYLLDECMVSSVVTATEAKTAALLEQKVKSVVTGTQATGTGTDSIVVVSGNGVRIRYAGGHTLFGQLLGDAVYRAVTSSLLKREKEGLDLNGIYKHFNF
jgi:iron complex transport system ATP-binding protein